MASSESLIRPPSWFFAKNQLQADVVKNMQEEHRERDRMQDKRFSDAKKEALGLIARTQQSWDSLSDHLITNSLRPGSPDAIDRIRRNNRRGFIARFFSSFFRSIP